MKQKREFDAEKALLETERAQAINNAVRSYEQDLGRMQTEHTEVIADLEEKHRAAISEVKKKQWVSVVGALLYVMLILFGRRLLTLFCVFCNLVLQL